MSRHRVAIYDASWMQRRGGASFISRLRGRHASYLGAKQIMTSTIRSDEFDVVQSFSMRWSLRGQMHMTAWFSSTIRRPR